MTVDILPDDALLEIFSFYLVGASHCAEPWLYLVHVCRRWRSIVFASQRRLAVRVFYTPIRQVKAMLEIWPNLPIQISARRGYEFLSWPNDYNLIAALEQTDRICEIHLHGFSSLELDRILPAMQKPFPALTSLTIESSSYYTPGAMAVLPQAFLGGSAQHLRSCILWAVEFPEILLTATHLVTLRLWHVPHSMHTSPEGMATCFSTMPNLESLFLGFLSPQSLHNWPDQPNRLLSPLTRVVLPSLTEFKFQFLSEYIEDFVSRIDVPLLDKFDITFIDQPKFDTPRLHDFLARIEKVKADGRGCVKFGLSSIEFGFEFGSLSFKLVILCGLGRQISSMAQFCGSSSHLPSALTRLDIVQGFISNLQHRDELENTQWLDLLHPFTGLKDLRLGKRFVLHHALAVRELAGGRVTEVLPVLQNLFIEGLEPSGPIQEALAQFVAARQLSGLPVVVHSWNGWS